MIFNITFVFLFFNRLVGTLPKHPRISGLGRLDGPKPRIFSRSFFGDARPDCLHSIYSKGCMCMKMSHVAFWRHADALFYLSQPGAQKCPGQTGRPGRSQHLDFSCDFSLHTLFLRPRLPHPCEAPRLCRAQTDEARSPR